MQPHHLNYSETSSKENKRKDEVGEREGKWLEAHYELLSLVLFSTFSKIDVLQALILVSVFVDIISSPYIRLASKLSLEYS